MKYEYGDTIVETEEGWVKDQGDDLQIVFVDTATDTLEISKTNLPRLIKMLKKAQERLQEKT